jgi:hypothetical protein
MEIMTVQNSISNISREWKKNLAILQIFQFLNRHFYNTFNIDGVKEYLKAKFLNTYAWPQYTFNMECIKNFHVENDRPTIDFPFSTANSFPFDVLCSDNFWPKLGKFIIEHSYGFALISCVVPAVKFICLYCGPFFQ